MKKVAVVMIAIVLIFCGFTCGILINRHRYVNTATLKILTEEQTDRYSSIHINKLGQLDINRATVEELCNLNGIGDVLANRIVQYREEHGPYKTVEELINIKGIGEVKLKNIIDYIYVG